MTPQTHCRYSELVSIAKLTPHPKNPNKHSTDQIDRLSKLFKYHGIRHPIIVSSKSGFIVAGHGRLQAAKKLKMDSFPVDYQDFDNDDAEYAFLCADNAIALWAELDIAAINLKVPDLGPDFDIDMLGIKDFVIEPADKFQGDEDEVPEPKEAIAKLGDLYQLGEHRLLCGDCTVEENVERLMGGEKADMVFTDPPYNHGSEDSLVASTVRQSMRKLKSSDWDKSFEIAQALKTIDLVKSDNSTVYICTSHHLAGKIFDWQAAARSGGYCIWVKPNPMPSLMKRHWTWDRELICYSTYGKHTFNFPNEGHAPASWIIQTNQINDLHPTMKPIAVCEMGISHSSNQGDVVFDGFLGSGSTLIACEKTKRKCYGMEIDPHYCDVIVARWEKFTGKKATLIQ